MSQDSLKVLAIDTATGTCSVALADGDRVMGETFLQGQKNHSEKLISLIDWLFESSSMSPADLDIVAVSSGPGSFTGLRVGISTAQGIAFSLGKDLVGVSTLEVLARQACRVGGYLCPMIDARKQQVYTCLYQCSCGGGLEKIVEEKVTEIERWLEDLPGPAIFTGSGACRWRESIEGAKSQHIVLPEFLSVPRASTLAVIAGERYLHNRRNELEEIVPVYIRPPDAEALAHKKKGGFNPIR